MMHLIEITKEEKELIELIRHIGYGKIEDIIIKDSQPTFVTKIYQTIKLGDNSGLHLDKM